MKRKSSFMRNLEIKSREDVEALFSSIFYANKYRREVLDKNNIEEISKSFNNLKEISKEYGDRIRSFNLRGMKKEDMEDMAKEIIHLLEPERYPLWTRWIWNKTKNTGSITYILREGINLREEKDFLESVKELRSLLSIFGFDTGNFYSTSIFLVYAYVRYLDYATHLAIDRKGAGLLPTHLTTTALVLGLKPFIRNVILNVR